MTQTLRAYSHPLISRDAFLAELQWHQDQDRIIKGAYSNGTDKTFRGCAVGCSLHSVKRIAKIKGHFGYGDHAQYPVYLGIPEILARLQDQIFEGLPSDMHAAFPVRFSASIQQGADLSGVWPKFAARILREIVIPTIQPEFDYVHVVVARVAVGWETNWSDDTPEAAGSAARSAWSALESAWSAAGSAARSAQSAAESARSAAWSAAWSAQSAAWSAGSAGSARSAAWSAGSAAYEKMADILCQELALAPVAA